MLVVHDWLKEYLGENIPSAKELEELLSLRAFEIEGVEEKEGHAVIDVDVLPNRSSDCLSHRGVAREIATLTDTTLAHDPFATEASLLPRVDTVSVQIEDPLACRRFGAALITGVSIAESPEWLQKRLLAIGQRPINNIVDATNYVMFALGQPLHAYDAGKLTSENSEYSIGVRMARADESITVLTGEEYTLDPNIQLIVDAGTDAPIGIAGIKGGAHAEIDTKTTDILLEAANFDPAVTRKASQCLRLQTDASKRFENEVPVDLVGYGLEEAVRLIADIASGTCTGYIDEGAGAQMPENTAVSVRLEKVNSLLGILLQKEEVERLYERLGFTYAATDVGWSVTAPFYRTDIQIEEDVIEELGRVHGYDAVPSFLPEHAPLAEINSRHYYSEKIRKTLQAIGFSEVITSSFRKKDKVRLLNALASDKQYLRSSLSKNITEVLDQNIKNADLLGLDDIRVFEIGTVFHADKEKQEVTEHVSVAIGARIKKTGYTPKDDVIVRAAVGALEEVLGVSIGAEPEKGVAELSLTELLAQVPTPSAYEPHAVSEAIQYKPFSPYPFITRDVALWVAEGTDPEDVEAVIQDAAGELCVRIRLFDKFVKENRVSYAFRLVFQSQEKTLTDYEVEPLMNAVYTAIEAKGWEVR